MMSAWVTWSAGFGLFGFENQGSMITVFPPGVRISTTEWPYQVMVVSRPSGIGESSFDWRHHRPAGRDASRRYTHGRARRTDRREPRVHQLDGPHRLGRRLVRGGRPRSRPHRRDP